MEYQNVQSRGGDSLAENTYTVLFEPAEEGGYNVVVPALPEVCTFGETLEEARAMAVDAIKCVLESMELNGEPIPSDIEPARERLLVTLP